MPAPQHTAAVFSIETRRKVLLWVIDQMKELNPDAIVVCGQSGIILGSIVCDRLNIPLIIVRKLNEPTVAYQPRLTVWDGNNCYQNWVWLDDLVASGSTFRHAAANAKADKAIETDIPKAMVLYCSDKEEYHGIPVRSKLSWEDSVE